MNNVFKVNSALYVYVSLSLSLSLKYSKISQLVRIFSESGPWVSITLTKNWNEETVFIKSTCIVNLVAYDLAIFYPNN